MVIEKKRKAGCIVLALVSFFSMACDAFAVVRAVFPVHQAYIGAAPITEYGRKLHIDPLGKYLIVRGFREVEVWSIEKPLYLGKFVADAAGEHITASHVSALGMLWLASSSGEISEWDLNSLKRLRSFSVKAVDDPVIHLLVDEEKELVFVYTGGAFLTFSASANKITNKTKPSDDECRELTAVDAGLLRCLTISGKLQFVRGAGGEFVTVPSKAAIGQDVRIRSISSSQNQSAAVYQDLEGCVYYINWNKNGAIGELNKLGVECRRVKTMLLSPDATRVALGYEDGMVSILDLKDPKTQNYDLSPRSVSAIVWSGDSKHAYVALTSDANRQFRQGISRISISKMSSSLDYYSANILVANDAVATASHLVTCLNTGGLQLWRLPELKLERQAMGLKSACSRVAASSDGKYAIAGDIQGNVYLIDLRVRAIVAQERVQHNALNSLGFFGSNVENVAGFFAGDDGQFKQLKIVNGKLKIGALIHKVDGAFQSGPIGQTAILVANNKSLKVVSSKGGVISFHDMPMRLSINRAANISLKSGSRVFSPSMDLGDGGYQFVDYIDGHWVRAKLPTEIKGYLAGTFLSGDVFLGGYLDGKIHAVDLRTGKTLDNYPAHGGEVNFIRSTPDGTRAFSFGEDGSIVVWDKSIQSIVARAWIWSDTDTAVVIPEGYFKFSGESPLKDILVRTNGSADQVVPALALYDVFNRPDIVEAKLRGDQGYVKRVSQELTIEKALKSPPPSIGAVSAPKSDISTARIRIPYTIKSEGGGVGEVLVFHNGKLVKSDGYYKDAPGSTMVALNTTKATSGVEVAKGVQKMLGSGESTSASTNRDSVVVRQAKPKTLNAAGEYSDSVEIDVIPGEENEITVMARNQDNTILGQGQTVRFKSSQPKADPHLWILPVGIASFQDSGVSKLVSPKKDALDFACSYGGKEALKNTGINCDKPGYASSLFKSANIHVIDPLTNGKATRANILAKLDEIATKAQPTDTFIWFVSSHGTMDANSVYGIVPFDAKCQGPKCEAASGLVSSNDILEKSKAIKAMKQLLILDTCNAGGLDNKMSGLYDARMSGLAKNMGLHLYAAATSTEAALDGQDANKNSIFTATLLEGLSGASPKDSEGRISIIPLGQYVKTNTAEASRKAYADITPQTPVIQHFGKDAPLAASMK